MHGIRSSFAPFCHAHAIYHFLELREVVKMGFVLAGLSPLEARPQGLQRWLGLIAELVIAIAAFLVSLITSCSVSMLK